MASTIPDLAIATTADIFSQPLVQVKKSHRQLHDLLQEKNAKLRTLVGGSYRQLLDTAETIVHMREEIQDVESKLESVTDGCGMGVLGRRVGGLAKLEGRERAQHGDGYARLGRAARLKALHGCTIMAGRMLRTKEANDGGKTLVMTAKVLVLSRLLLKSLADDEKTGDYGSEATAAELKRKLGSLRKRLLRVVERRVESQSTDREELLQALCAYSLTTNSGAKDVLRHFLSVRGQAMATRLEVEDEGGFHKEVDQEAVSEALGLLAKTLLDVQAIAPKRLSDALASLKAKHLLEDESFMELEGLRLDVCAKWFGDEITYFTPYIPHDDQDGPQAVKTLESWSKKASEVLLQGFGKILDAIIDFKDVVTLRPKVLKVWVAEGGKVKKFDSSEMVNGLREVINKRLTELLESRVERLKLFHTQIEAAVEQITHGAIPHASLWDDELLGVDLKNGAFAFRETVIERTHGRDDSTSRALASYRSWKELVDEMAADIQQLRSQKWNDDLDSLEDEDVLDERQKNLSIEDPELLQNSLESSLEEAFAKLEESLQALMNEHEGNERGGDVAILMLRIVRDIRAELPEKADIVSFGLSLVPELHQLLAERISSKTIDQYTTSLETRKRVAGRALWEGTPELPIYPWPATFKFMYDTTAAAADVGGDLWSQTAVGVLKKHMSKCLATEIEASLPSPPAIEEPKTNGEADPVADSDQKEDQPSPALTPEANEAAQERYKDILTQSLFDTLVLRHCLRVSGTEEAVEELVELEKLIKSKADLPSAANDRLAKSALDYHKRTSLLLGPLA